MGPGHDNWKEAMERELESLNDNHVWDSVELQRAKRLSDENGYLKGRLMKMVMSRDIRLDFFNDHIS